MVKMPKNEAELTTIQDPVRRSLQGGFGGTESPQARPWGPFWRSQKHLAKQDRGGVADQKRGGEAAGVWLAKAA